MIAQPMSNPAHLWLKGFFDETYGWFSDQPIKRPDQGEFEVREALL